MKRICSLPQPPSPLHTGFACPTLLWLQRWGGGGGIPVARVSNDMVGHIGGCAHLREIGLRGVHHQGCSKESPLIHTVGTVLVVALVITIMGGGEGLKASENVNNPPHAGTDQHSWLTLTGEKFPLPQICLESPQCSSLP